MNRSPAASSAIPAGASSSAPPADTAVAVEPRRPGPGQRRGSRGVGNVGSGCVGCRRGGDRRRGTVGKVEGDRGGGPTTTTVPAMTSLPTVP